MKPLGNKPLPGSTENLGKCQNSPPKNTEPLSACNKKQCETIPNTPIVTRKAKLPMETFGIFLFDTYRSLTNQGSKPSSPSSPSSPPLSESSQESGIKFGEGIHNYNDLEWAIYEAGGPVISEPSGPDPASTQELPTLEKAITSSSDAVRYVKYTNNCKMDLKKLIDTVKAQSSKKQREDFFDKIFTAKTLDEWWNFAFEQAISTGIDAYQTSITKLLAETKSEKSINEINKEPGDALLKMTTDLVSRMPEDRAKQIKGLGYLIKAYSARLINTLPELTELTDNLDTLQTRKLPQDFNAESLLMKLRTLQ